MRSMEKGLTYMWYTSVMWKLKEGAISLHCDSLPTSYLDHCYPLLTPYMDDVLYYRIQKKGSSAQELRL